MVEVMVATVILALSTVFLSEAFFISLDSYNYCSRYLKVLSWADEKIWETQESLSRTGPAAALNTSGNFLEKEKNFIWYLAYAPVQTDDLLYKVDLDLSWQEGARKARLQRSAYALYHKPKE